MKNMTLKNITAACHGTFHGDSSFLEKEITGVAIDSRKAAQLLDRMSADDQVTI